MDMNVIYVGLDVVDTQYIGSALKRITGVDAGLQQNRRIQAALSCVLASIAII